MNYQNKNYLHCFKVLYHNYKTQDPERANEIKKLVFLIAQNSPNKKLIDNVIEDFK